MKFPKKKVVELLGQGWAEFLWLEFNKRYMLKVGQYVAKQRRNLTVYPEKKDVFRAYRLTPYDQVRVVIVGQDPYYNGLADGLAFSSAMGGRVPKSLLNIFKEVENSTGYMPHYNNPDLSRWAAQGVFLINTALTTAKGTPRAHSGIGWETFTGRSIKAISMSPVPTVFFLWGSHAKGFKQYILPENHLILEAYHPSPRSADRGFFGCDHFRKCNEFLKQHNLNLINWK